MHGGRIWAEQTLTQDAAECETQVDISRNPRVRNLERRAGEVTRVTLENWNGFRKRGGRSQKGKMHRWQNTSVTLMNAVLRVLANGPRWEVGGSEVAGVAEKWWCGGCGCDEASRGQTEKSIIYGVKAATPLLKKVDTAVPWTLAQTQFEVNHSHLSVTLQSVTFDAIGTET